MAVTLDPTERKVLEAYAAEDTNDPEGAYAPYYPSISAAAGSNLDQAYAACKALKKKGLLTTNGRQGSKLASAPAYWITDAGKAALA